MCAFAHERAYIIKAWKKKKKKSEIVGHNFIPLKTTTYTNAGDNFIPLKTTSYTNVIFDDDARGVLTLHGVAVKMKGKRLSWHRQVPGRYPRGHFSTHLCLDSIAMLLDRVRPPRWLNDGDTETREEREEGKYKISVSQIYIDLSTAEKFLMWSNHLYKLGKVHQFRWKKSVPMTSPQLKEVAVEYINSAERYRCQCPPVSKAERAQSLSGKSENRGMVLHLSHRPTAWTLKLQTLVSLLSANGHGGSKWRWKPAQSFQDSRTLADTLDCG